MATANYIQDKGYDAATALVKCRAVKFSAVETVTPVTAATDLVAGINQYDVTAPEITKGKGAMVRRMGASIMEASEELAVGDEIAVSANGRAQKADATERVIGICDEAASGAGKFARVTLSLPGYIKA